MGTHFKIKIGTLILRVQKITVSTTHFGKSTLIGKIFAKTILGAPISNWWPR